MREKVVDVWTLMMIGLAILWSGFAVYLLIKTKEARVFALGLFVLLFVALVVGIVAKGVYGWLV